MTARQKLMTAAVLPYVLAAAAFLFIYQPSRAQIEQARGRAAQIESELTAQRLFLSSAAIVGTQIQSLEEQRRKLLDDLVSSDSTELFLEAIGADMLAMGFSAAALKPDIDDLLHAQPFALDDLQLLKLRFVAEAQADYITVAQWIEDFESRHYSAGVPMVSLSFNESTNPEILARITIQAYLRAGAKRCG